MQKKSINESIILIKNDIIDRATLFLNEMGEFYPFGTALDYNDKTIPVIYSGKEFTDSNLIIKELQQELYKGLIEDEFKLVGLGIDIHIPTDGPEKASALEIQVMDVERIIAEFRLPYIMNEFNKVEFGDLIIISW
jgi:hypothetical protein